MMHADRWSKLIFKMPITIVSVFVVCWNGLEAFLSNYVDPDQSAP